MMAKTRFVRWLVPIGVASIVLTLTLLLLYDEALRRAILEPVTWMLHDVRRSLSSLPQAVLWIIVLLIGCVGLVASWRRMLIGLRSKPDRRRWAVIKPYNPNALESLARDLDRAPKRHVSRVRVVRELSILAVRLIAQKEGLPLEEARKLLHSGRWPEDPRVRRFFASRRDGKSGVPRHSFLEAAAHTLAHLERYHQEV